MNVVVWQDKRKAHIFYMEIASSCYSSKIVLAGQIISTRQKVRLIWKYKGNLFATLNSLS